MRRESLGQCDVQPLTTRLFNFSRIPLPGCDAFSAIAPEATHTTLMIDDFVYSVEVFKPSGVPGKSPIPLPVDEVAKSFRGAARDARQRRKAGEEPLCVGILTADHRDTWAVVSVMSGIPALYPVTHTRIVRSSS